MAIPETIITSILAPIIGIAVLYGNTIVQGIKRREIENSKELQDMRDSIVTMQHDIIILTKDLATTSEQNVSLKNEVGRLTQENSSLKTQMTNILLETIKNGTPSPA
jgi:predicted RNase H-like nuclease (RuvC/YqgF family)